LRLEFWPLDRLVPSVRNARTHSDAQVAEIAGSIRAFGFTNPILVGEDGDVVPRRNDPKAASVETDSATSEGRPAADRTSRSGQKRCDHAE
jgi:hypothetical protein